MTVAHLIDRLRKENPDALVVFAREKVRKGGIGMRIRLRRPSHVEARNIDLHQGARLPHLLLWVNEVWEEFDA